MSAARKPFLFPLSVVIAAMEQTFPHSSLNHDCWQETYPPPSLNHSFYKGTFPPSSLNHGFYKGTFPPSSLNHGFYKGTFPPSSLTHGFYKGTFPSSSLCHGFYKGVFFRPSLNHDSWLLQGSLTSLPHSVMVVTRKPSSPLTLHYNSMQTFPPSSLRHDYSNETFFTIY